MTCQAGRRAFEPAGSGSKARLRAWPEYTASFAAVRAAACEESVDAMNEERAPSPRPRCRRLTGVRLLATGSYVPDAIVTNEHLHAKFGFDSEWIVKRTGILERRHALAHQATSDLCHQAALRCLTKADVDPKDIDLLLVGTFTPDMTFPATACLVQDRLKLACPAVEIQAG